MRKEAVLLAVLLFGGTFVLGGCVAAAVGAGAGAVAYIRGDLEAVWSENIADVYEASEKAIKQLELSEVSKTKDALSAVVIARDAQDKKIKIKLKAINKKSTEISIRIGLFGDEVKSRLIYDKIRDNL